MSDQKPKKGHKIARKHGIYLKMHEHDIGKKSIPPKDRCPDFDDLWNRTFDEVMAYWDWVPVDDITEIL